MEGWGGRREEEGQPKKGKGTQRVCSLGSVDRWTHDRDQGGHSWTVCLHTATHATLVHRIKTTTTSTHTRNRARSGEDAIIVLEWSRNVRSFESGQKEIILLKSKSVSGINYCSFIGP